jgi:hypothetical protein
MDDDDDDDDNDDGDDDDDDDECGAIGWLNDKGTDVLGIY